MRLPLFGQRTELAQRALAVAHQAAVGRFDERECLDVAQLERVHLQDHRRQVGTLDFRLGELGPRREILFRIQAYGDARPHTAATAGALIRRRL